METLRQVICEYADRCPQAKEFGEFTCIHQRPHEPIEFADHSNCSTADSSCLYFTGRCVPIEPEIIEAVRRIAEVKEYDLVPA